MSERSCLTCRLNATNSEHHMLLEECLGSRDEPEGPACELWEAICPTCAENAAKLAAFDEMEQALLSARRLVCSCTDLDCPRRKLIDAALDAARKAKEEDQ